MKNILLTLMFLSSALFAQTRIAAVGNSITYGYSFSNRSTEPYPAVLQSLLGNSYSVSNFGVSGATMLKLGDNTYWSKSEYGNAKSFAPNIVIIELGTNDSKDHNWYVRPSEFPADYKSMIQEFRALSSPPEIWVCLAPYSNNEGWKIRDTTITKRINPDILQVAQEKGTHVIDLHSTFTDHSLIMSDSVHPTIAGAAQLAAIVRDHLLRDTLVIRQINSTLYAPAGFGFQWYKNGTPISGATQQTLNISELGKYKVSVKVEANNDSRIVSKTLTVTDLTSGIPVYSSAFEILSSSVLETSSSSATTTLASTSGYLKEIKIQGNGVQMQLPVAGSIQITLYDIQGREEKKFTVQGQKGFNQFSLPNSKGAHIVTVRFRDHTQSDLWIHK